MGLELLAPKGLWLLAGIAPLVALYILKIKRQRLKVPSTWLWDAARRDLLAKQPFRRLLPEVSLLLELLALAALALALARPALRGGRVTGDHVAIVIDASASMGTASLIEGGKASTRMADALAAANDIVSALEPGADALIVEASREAKIVSPFDRDVKKLRGAIARIDVREVEGDLGRAVALAADRLRSLGGRKRIVIITDAALAKEAPLAAAGVETQLVTVGAPTDNAAIVRIDVRSGTDPATKRDQAQVFAMVQNWAKTPRDAYLTLTVEGQQAPVASRRVLVPAEGKIPVVLTFDPKREDQGAGLVVELSPGDALPIDDRAFGRVPAGTRMPVVLASNAEYSWVQRALEADSTVDLQRLTLTQLGTVNVDADALVVVEGACPDALPGHDVLVIAPPVGTCLGADVKAKVEQPQITSWESGDARLRFLTLDGVHVTSATPLAAAGAGASLVRAGTITLVADASVPGRTATIVGFDVGESDWPLKASFVLFVRNIVETARVHRAHGAAGPARTGDPLRIAVPAGVDEVTVAGPGMDEHPVSAKGGFAIVPPVERAGIYHVKWTAPRYGATAIAVNLTSAEESDVRPKIVSVDGASAALSNTRVADPHHELGMWLALLAAVLIALDVLWITRNTRAPRRTAPKAGRPREATP
jgi:hypothetical protein